MNFWRLAGLLFWLGLSACVFVTVAGGIYLGRSIGGRNPVADLIFIFCGRSFGCGLVLGDPADDRQLTALAVLHASDLLQGGRWTARSLKL